MTVKQIFYSKYNDLSKIYDMKTKMLIKIIPSPIHYFDCKENKIGKIPVNLLNKYSILGINKNNNNTNNRATLIKLKSGFIALKIPYMNIIKFNRI